MPTEKELLDEAVAILARLIGAQTKPDLMTYTNDARAFLAKFDARPPGVTPEPRGCGIDTAGGWRCGEPRLCGPCSDDGYDGDGPAPEYVARYAAPPREPLAGEWHDAVIWTARGETVAGTIDGTPIEGLPATPPGVAAPPREEVGVRAEGVLDGLRQALRIVEEADCYPRQGQGHCGCRFAAETRIKGLAGTTPKGEPR